MWNEMSEESVEFNPNPNPIPIAKLETTNRDDDAATK